MKRPSILFMVLILFVGIMSCEKENANANDDQKTPELSQKSAKAIVDANNKFAFEFFSEVAKSDTNQNYMVSPVSLSLALGMAYNGSNGSTKLAFENVLNYNTSLLEVNQFNKNLIGNLSSSADGSVMEIANSLWIEKTFPVKDEFVDLNRNNYYAEVRNLDFGDPASVDTINGWVSDKTHEKIPGIIDKISEDERLFLINALYFNASWKYEFDSAYTQTLPFYKTPTETTEAEMMTMTEVIGYSQNELFSSIILPYENNKFSMVILLPNQGKTTDDIVSELNSLNWTTWLNDYDTTEVVVSIPKFKLEYKNKLNDELIEMGLGVAFTPAADFSNISDIPLMISYVLQKTFIDVSEEGTEAAAVTIIGFKLTATVDEPPTYIHFNANRPFLYVIKDNETGSICFIGKVGEPKYE